MVTLLSISISTLSIEIWINYTFRYSTQLETVCVGRSTIYNTPRVKNWLRTQLFLNWHNWWDSGIKNRIYFMALRKQLFEQGRSEECHTRNNSRILPYLQCSLMRNQRMEYMIPMYPLHQVYFHFLTTLKEDLFH